MVEHRLDVQNQDGSYAKSMAPGQLMHPGYPHNMTSGQVYKMTANQWKDDMEWMPALPFKVYDRIRDEDGSVNPSTNVIDLENDTGAADSGDIFLLTWVHEGPDNDNIHKVKLWLKWNSVAGLTSDSKIRLALVNITDVCDSNGALNDLEDHDMTPITLDKIHAWSTALAYAEIDATDVVATGNGQPTCFHMCYNSHEEQDSLTAGEVYGLVLYVSRNGSETGKLYIYGADDADLDANSSFYFGSAGWNGTMAADTTVKAPWYIIMMAKACSVNQFHVRAADGELLGGGRMCSAIVMPPDTNKVGNIPDDDGIFDHGSIFHNLEFADEKSHHIILEGKSLIPRYHRLNFNGMVTYTGNLTINVNFWCNACGDIDNMKP